MGGDNDEYHSDSICFSLDKTENNFQVDLYTKIPIFRNLFIDIFQ